MRRFEIVFGALMLAWALSPAGLAAHDKDGGRDDRGRGQDQGHGWGHGKHDSKERHGHGHGHGHDRDGHEDPATPTVEPTATPVDTPTPEPTATPIPSPTVQPTPPPPVYTGTLFQDPVLGVIELRVVDLNARRVQVLFQVPAGHSLAQVLYGDLSLSSSQAAPALPTADGRVAAEFTAPSTAFGFKAQVDAQSSQVYTFVLPLL